MERTEAASCISAARGEREAEATCFAPGETALVLLVAGGSDLELLPGPGVFARGLADPSPAVRLTAWMPSTCREPLLSCLSCAKHFETESASDVRLAIVGRLGSLATPAAREALREMQARKPGSHPARRARARLEGSRVHAAKP